VVPGATLTVATIAPSDPAPIGSTAVDVQVSVSFGTVVVDRAQV
jgi:hypothetical protein